MNKPGSTRPAITLVALALTFIAGMLSPAAQQHPAVPQRIVSLVPAVTEMLFAVGAGPRVIAVSNFDKFPPPVQQLPKVGALLDPDLERILALRPDLVVVYHSQKDLVTQLTRAGIPHFSYAHAGLPDVTQTIRQVGARTGTAKEAERVAAGIEAAMQAVRASVKGRPRPRTLVVFGREAFTLRGIYANGGYGFVHDMVAAAGGENVFADFQRQSVQATSELILTRRPDVILELRANPMAPDVERREIATWSALSSLPAVRNRRVHIIADERTVVPGPRVGEGAAVLARVLHGVQ